jgi:hypothetical protein
VGLSKIREKHIFGGLPVQQRCEKLLCGVAVVDLRSGQEVGLFEFTAGCEELYDVAFLPGVHRPMILNLQKPVVRQAITNPDSSYWLRPSSEIRDQSGTPDGGGTRASVPTPGRRHSERSEESSVQRDSSKILRCAQNDGELLDQSAADRNVCPTATGQEVESGQVLEF